MMAAIIFVVSVVTLLMFFVSYCRSLVASCSRHTLSQEVCDVAGIPARASGQDFTRIMQFLRLCPEGPQDRTGIQAVGLYYAILNLVQKSVARAAPSLYLWTEHERAGCANFAAMVLERRIAFSREILAQQGEL